MVCGWIVGGPRIPTTTEVDEPGFRETIRSALFRRANCPKIIREVGILQIRIGHGEVTFHAPIGVPRVADEETFLRIVVSYGHDRVAAGVFLVMLRHVENAGLFYFLRFERFVNGETENEREPIREETRNVS